MMRDAVSGRTLDVRAASRVAALAGPASGNHPLRVKPPQRARPTVEDSKQSPAAWPSRIGRNPTMTIPAKADVDDATRDSLFSLSAGDLDVLEEGLKLRDMWQQQSGLDARAYSLCKIAALVAVDAPPASYLFQVATALASGVTPNEILGVLHAVAPQVGFPRVVASAPEIVVALGLTLPDSV
jgi:4-carboxymuconolactone decarboxylase